MYSFRATPALPGGPVDLAFTDRYGGVSAPPYDELNLAVSGGDDEAAREQNRRRVHEDFGPDDVWCDLDQVHGADVVEAGSSWPSGPSGPSGSVRPRADGIVSAAPGRTLVVRAADCVPVLLAATTERVVGAAHCGRPGLVAGVVPATVAAMRGLGATDLQAWVGPHVCGRCYEVPETMRAEIAGAVPESWAETSWGTPSVDLGAGVRAQLAGLGVQVHDVSRCTRESADLYSYRRDGEGAGRLLGLVRIAAP